MRISTLPLAVLASVTMASACAEDSNQAVSSGSAFNPQISLILGGDFYRDSESGQLQAPSGINTASRDVGNQGFNLGAAELVLSATVDPHFDALATMVLIDGKAELEEAWFETRTLPHGLKLRAGRVKSNIGYLNNQHPHAWNFADQNLAYNALLGGEGLADTGVRLEWLPGLPLYTLVGVEALQGEQQAVGALVDPSELAGAATGAISPADDGPRLLTAYIKVAPELGDNHALLLGLSGVQAKQQQELFGNAAAADQYALEGDATVYIFEAVYKYDASGEWGQGDLKLQAEYLSGQKELEVTAVDGNAVFLNGATPHLGEQVNAHEDAWYIQAIYGFAPRWQLGVRLDQSGLNSDAEEAGVKTSFSESSRVSAALTWSLTEFSRLRVQYSQADVTNASSTGQKYEQYFLTYSMSLGTHGAHKF